MFKESHPRADVTMGHNPNVTETEQSRICAVKIKVTDSFCGEEESHTQEREEFGHFVWHSVFVLAVRHRDDTQNDYGKPVLKK